jgi:hypothetical protein
VERALGTVVAWLADFGFARIPSAVFLLLNIHAFLAVTHCVNTNVLVVEGWIFYLSDGLFTPSRRNSSLRLDLMSKRADYFYMRCIIGLVFKYDDLLVGNCNL